MTAAVGLHAKTGALICVSVYFCYLWGSSMSLEIQSISVKIHTSIAENWVRSLKMNLLKENKKHSLLVVNVKGRQKLISD